jgi:hypothetical protein
MSDDAATIRAKNRADIVAIGVRALGENRRRDCEILAGLVEANIDRILASPSTTSRPAPRVSRPPF